MLMRRLVRILGPLLVLTIVAAAVTLLHRELRQFTYQDLRRDLEGIPAERIAAAAVLTVANYLVLCCFDLVSFRAIGQPLSFGKVAFSSFIGYACSYNFGATLGGGSVRYRLFSGWGLPAAEIARMLAILTLTFWIGFSALAGVVFLIAPLPLPQLVNLPFTTVRPLGVLLVAVTVAYLAASATGRPSIRVRDWELRLPGLRVSFAQIAIASLDMLTAAAVFHALLPPSLGLSYTHALTVYLLAVVAVLFTHAPGGLGVFELVVIVMLRPVGAAVLAGSLLVFRVMYYLIPLALSMVLLAGSELALHCGRGKRLPTVRRLDIADSGTGGTNDPARGGSARCQTA